MLLKAIQCCIPNERQEPEEGTAGAQESLDCKILETAAEENAALGSLFHFIALLPSAHTHLG